MTDAFVFDEHAAAFSVVHQNVVERSKIVPPRSSDPLRYRGWGVKHGYRKLSSWRKRFFVLEAECINYYKSESAKKPKGTIRLNCYCQVGALRAGVRRNKHAVSDFDELAEKQVQKQHGWYVFDPMVPRSYEIFCANDVERDEWIRCVQNNYELILQKPEVVQRIVAAIREGAPESDGSDSILRNAGLAKNLLRLRHLTSVHTVVDDPLLPVLELVSKGDLAGVHVFFQMNQGANISQKSKDSSSSLVFHAAQQKRRDILEWLLQRGADPSGKNYQGDSPLLFMTRANDVETMKILLRFGANRRAANFFGETPLGEARELGLEAAEEVLLNYEPTRELPSKELPGPKDYICSKCLEPVDHEKLHCDKCDLDIEEVRSENVADVWSLLYGDTDLDVEDDESEKEEKSDTEVSGEESVSEEGEESESEDQSDESDDDESDDDESDTDESDEGDYGESDDD